MTLSFPGGTAVHALWKGHRIETDQPEADGGNDSAPSPFDYFLASIATCVGFYVLKFCRARELPTDGLEIEMRSHRDAATMMISEIDVGITLPPEFPEKYRDAILRAADQCAVKRHLHDPPAVKLHLR